MFCPTNMMMPTLQSMCSCFHCAVNQALAAGRQAYVLQNYQSIDHVVPTPVAVTPQPQPRTVSEASYVSGATDKTLYLWQSVFKLVYENIYLALTDSKLLGWYLALSPENRKIIQEEGGFHCFLKKHPALELSKHHIYVKKVVPDEQRAHFPHCSSNHNSSNQHLHTSFNSPALQRVEPKGQGPSRLMWPMANSSYNAQNVANLSLDVELEKRKQRANPQSSFNGALHHSSGHHSSSWDASSQEMGHKASWNEDLYYSILEADNSIVLCVPKESPETSLLLPEDSVSNSEPFIPESINAMTENRATSPIFPIYTCDAMVGTEQTISMASMSQTESPPTADKRLNTEVYMLDLDYLTKEFITIKKERDELLEKLEKLKMQRVTSPFAKMLNDLRKLEADYSKMRETVMSGISLNDFKALSLDSEEESPDSALAKVIGDNELDSQGFKEEQTTTVAVSDNNSQESETMSNASGQAPCKMMKAVARIPKEKCPIQKTESKSSDLNSNETWYDAEEDLPSKESGEQSKVDEKPAARESPDDTPTFMSAGLCVSGLPMNVTKNDVLIWFKKYQVSEIHISKLKELSVAIVIVKSQSSAEAAVKELNGLRIKGHTLQVERINTGQSEDQGQPSTCEPEGSRSPIKNQSQITSSSPKKKVVCVSPTAQGNFVSQHYGTMGSFEILMSELTRRHPNVRRQRIVDALLELRAKYRGVLSGLPLRTIRDMTSDLLLRPACKP